MHTHFQPHLLNRTLSHLWYLQDVTSPQDASGAMPTRAHFRANARFSTSTTATVTLLETSQTLQGKVRNMGLGGLCLEVDAEVSSGQSAVLLLATPWLWEPLRLQGDVVWVRGDAYPALVGIRFQHTSHQTIQLVFEFLEHIKV